MRSLRWLSAGVLVVLVACGDEDSGALRGRPGAEEGASDSRLDFSSSPLRRLTRTEIRAALQTLLPGFPINEELIRALPEDSVSPFDNDAPTQVASQRLVAAASDLAEDMAGKLVSGAAPRDVVIGCTPKGNRDDDCLRAFVERFGKHAFRRPLKKEESDDFVSRLGPIGDQQGDFNAAVGRIVSAMLQDVEFLYHIETGEPAPGDPSRVVISDYAIGSRMAALLWGGAPDDDVFGYADRAELGKAAGRRAAAEAMLKSPKARAHIARFHAMWIGYETSLPQTSAIGGDIKDRLRAESDALVQKIVLDDKRSWFDLWRSRETYMDDTLATYYGDVPMPGSSTAKWATYGESTRQGLLGHGTLYNVANKFADTSPTQRGKMIRERLLCQTLPKVPPDLQVNNDVQPNTSKCKLASYKAIQQNPGCAQCHKTMDSIGFGLENFDLGGKFRKVEPAGNDCPIDGHGIFADNGADKTFSGPRELADILLSSKDFEACLEKRVAQYALGRTDTPDDKPTLDAMSDSFKKNGERLDQLLIEIVASPKFAQKKVD